MIEPRLKTTLLILILFFFLQNLQAANSNDQFAAASKEMTARHFPEAIAIFSALLKANPKRTDCLLNRGLCLCWSDHWAEGVADFSRLIALEPSNYDAHVHRGNARAVIRDFNGSLADAETAIRLQPRLSGGYASKGWTLIRMGKFDQASRLFDSAKVADPDGLQLAKETGLITWADMQVTARKSQSALQLIEKIPNWQKNAPALRVHALALDAMGNRTKALQDIGAAIELQPKDAELRYARVRWLDVKGPERRKIAAADLAAIKAEHEGDANYWNVVTDFEARQGNWSKATESISRAIKIKPEEMQFRSVRAQMEVALKRPQAAIVDYRQYLRVHPTDTAASLAMAVLQRSLGNQLQAFHTLDMAITNAPNPDSKAAALQARADCHFETGDDRQAVKDYSEALRNAPGNMAILQKRAQIFDELGDVQEAKRDWAAVDAIKRAQASHHRR